MNDAEIIKAALTARKYTQDYLAQKAEYSGQGSISRLLRAKNSMRVDNFVKLLNAMDFEVVVRSKTKSGEEWKVEM